MGKDIHLITLLAVAQLSFSCLRPPTTPGKLLKVGSPLVTSWSFSSYASLIMAVGGDFPNALCQIFRDYEPKITKRTFLDFFLLLANLYLFRIYTHTSPQIVQVAVPIGPYLDLRVG